MTDKQIKALNKKDILKIVLYWYNNIEPEIFQSEKGEDLEEILEPQIFLNNETTNKTRQN